MLLLNKTILLIFVGINLAKWQSGNAAACKAVNAGSIPTLALEQMMKEVIISKKVFTEI